MTGHPICEHGVGFGDDFDVECCICASNPCDAVTVELMVRHRDYDIDVWTRVPAGGGFDAPPF